MVLNYKYCLIYFDYTFGYVLHGYIDRETNKITFENTREDLAIIHKLDLKSKEKKDVFVESFIIDSDTEFYTTAKYNSNLYKLLKNKISSNNLNFIANLNNDELKEQYREFIDLTVGDDLLYSNDIAKRKIEGYLKKSDENNIDSKLIPYLYFIKYIKPSNNIDYIICFSTLESERDNPWADITLSEANKYF